MTTSQQSAWERLFPDRDFSFSFGTRPADARAFFAEGEEHDALLKQRQAALDEAPCCHLFESPEAAAAVAESIRWAGLESGDCRQLALHWEPDFLILLPGPGEQFLFKAGAVCFPSSWRPEEKIGLPLHAIHTPVPTLNENLGTHIDKFLSNLKPGTSWQRFNWGLSGSPDLNQHPRLNKRRLTAPLTPEKTWIRIEDQILLRLPDTGAILFGIRLVNISLVDLKKQPQACSGLHRAIKTMPGNIAEYKSITPVHDDLLQFLRA